MIGIRLRVTSSEGDRSERPRLFVRIEGSGRNVLLLHGGGPGTCGEGWSGLMREAAGGGLRDVRFHAPDFVGFGESDAPGGVTYGQPRFVSDTIALIDCMCLEPVVLVGHSMGAAVAAGIAATRPDLVSHLVLVAPGGGTYGLEYASPGIEQVGRVAEDPSESNMRALVELMSHRRDLHEDQVAKRMTLIRRPDLLEVQRKLDRSRKAATPAGAATRATVGEKLRAATMPMLLLWGEHERFNPFETGASIRRALPAHARYQVIEGAGHNVQYDQPLAVAQAIARFLDD